MNRKSTVEPELGDEAKYYEKTDYCKEGWI